MKMVHLTRYFGAKKPLKKVILDFERALNGSNIYGIICVVFMY